MDVRFFREQGYQILRNVVEQDTIGIVRNFLEVQSCEAIAALHQALGTNDIPNLCAKIEMTGKDKNLDAIDRELRLSMSGHFPLPVRLSQVLWLLAKQPRLRNSLREIFGDDNLYMHMPPTARFVLPGNSTAGVPAHQDVSYNKHMTDFVTVWIPFTEIDDACGGVAVFEGSNVSLEHLADYKRGFWLNGIDTKSYRRIHCKMVPGDILLLNRWIIHESVPNTSDRIRHSVDLRFFNSAQQSLKHYLDLQSWEVRAPVEDSASLARAG